MGNTTKCFPFFVGWKKNKNCLKGLFLLLKHQLLV